MQVRCAVRQEKLLQYINVITNSAKYQNSWYTIVARVLLFLFIYKNHKIPIKRTVLQKIAR